MPHRPSHPDSPYCGTKEAAALAFTTMWVLRNYRTRYPAHFGPQVVSSAPGSNKLVWHKQKTIEAVAKVRGMAGEAAA